jgi:hypothetical protein
VSTGASQKQSHPEETLGQTLYSLEVYRPAVVWARQAETAQTIVRLPVVLPAEAPGFRLLDAEGQLIKASLINILQLPDDCLAGELVFAAALEADGRHPYYLLSAPGWDRGGELDRMPDDHTLRLQNRRLDLCLCEGDGVESFTFEGQEIGSAGFLSPFITYRSGRRSHRWLPSPYSLEPLAGETWDGLSRARISTEIVMDTQHGPEVTKLQYTFTLCDDLPYLLVDVAVDYARTVPQDVIHTMQQKLRRLLDLRWVEVAPCQLKPRITSRAKRPLRIWKHNHHGVTTCYDLDYSRVNARNRKLDSFNHQVTAGWLSVSNGQVGLLLAENAEILSSMAFCPMRLRERDGIQELSLNPFGSYHGRQLDYSHLGGNGVGAELTEAASGALRPNGPSYNGQRLTFSLLLAPYQGDAPPSQLQADALAHFYPAGAIYLQVPGGPDAVTTEDVRRHIGVSDTKRLQAAEAPLPTPRAFLANPSDRAVDLVWEAQRDARVVSYEVRWRATGDSEWQTQTMPAEARWQVAGLRNGQRYRFQLRSLGSEDSSDWTPQAEVEPGPVGAPSLLTVVPSAAPWTLVRMVGHSLAHVLRTRLSWWLTWPGRRPEPG